MIWQVKDIPNIGENPIKLLMLKSCFSVSSHSCRLKENVGIFCLKVERNIFCDVNLILQRLVELLMIDVSTLKPHISNILFIIGFDIPFSRTNNSEQSAGSRNW